ncbi:MAG: hypothetical protein PF541_05655 [Prolixibacteraceae bacterium]|nr:hypothetical protein [Prolixibacteraceae bacterium]
MKKIILGAISGLLLFFVSCTEFEKFESTDLEAAPTVTIKMEEVKDSSIVVSVSSTATGFITGVLVEGVGNVAPDSTLLIQGNVEALDAAYTEVLEADVKIMYEIGGLTQNTKYEIFTVAQNEDGVLSDVVKLMVSTTDAYNPVLVGVDPGPAYDAEQSTTMEVVLVFDEPIGAADASKFTFSYFYEGVDAVAGDAVVDSENPYQVIVSQSRSANDGEYIWLSFAEGAVTDLVGNPVASFTTGFNEAQDGFEGLYWRVAKVGWDVDVETVVPTAASAVADPEFVIELSAPVAVSSDAEDGSVRLIVVSAGVKSVYEVPAANVMVAEDGTSISIYKPFTPDYGESIYLEVDAGTFTDVFGNPNNVIESGIDEIANEDDPITEIGWLISYGYEMDMILGSYDVDGLSAVADYGYPDEPFSVEITADPDNADQVLITGMYFSAVPIPATFDGDFATITITLPYDADLEYSWIELGDLYGDGASNSLEIYDGGDFATIILNINADGSIYTNDDIWWGSYYFLDDGNADNDGWNNIFGATNWTKSVAAGINVNSSETLKSGKIRLPKAFK